MQEEGNAPSSFSVYRAFKTLCEVYTISVAFHWKLCHNIDWIFSERKEVFFMAKPLVAIVGRPNVGKSMLFNKLTGHRTSIVEDTPGVTRDRIYGDCEWCNRHFSLVDTGGIEPGTDSDMLKFMRRQAEIGIELADCVVMVVDVKSGMTAADEDVATMLRKCGKPVALGDMGFRFPVFGPLSVIVKFYRADEDFPASITFLWDENMLSFVFYETVFYVAGFILEAICEQIRNTDNQGEGLL